ncbi:hypothetical protein TRAPUB_4708, partial [Trametes pubescens]
HQCKLVGWPASIPFTSISEIRGGVLPLLELLRRWNLPDGDADKLRFERVTPEDIANAARDPGSVHPNPTQLEAERLKAAAAKAEKAQAKAALRFERATPEDIANAARDPESVHPNPTQLEAEKLKAAAAKAEEAQAKAAVFVVPVCTHHPYDLRFVGLDLTSTQPASDSVMPKAERNQRVDQGRRRKRKSDGSLRVRKRLPKRGITSSRCVIPGVEAAGGMVGRAAKRARLDDCAVDDPIDRFVLSTEFGGPLSGVGA